MSEIKLKPCPFCGGEAEIREWYIKGIANRKHFRSYCKKCGCECRNNQGYKHISKAVEKWNERADQSQQEGE